MLHGHPQDPHAIAYGNDGRQDGQQGVNCPTCRKFIYYTLQDAMEETNLYCQECGKSFPVSMTDPTNKPTKSQLGGNGATSGTHIFIGAAL